MDFGRIFIQEFERTWDGAIIGIIAAIIWYIMGKGDWSKFFRVFIAFLFLLAITFIYASLLAFQEYFNWF